MGIRVSTAALIVLGLFAPAPGEAALAGERLCDASAENCRTPLIDLINNERQGIDVGVWFWKDDRFVTALVNAKNRGVPIRIIMDPRANVQYPTNKGELDKLQAAGIPMRKRIAGDICHWKLMIFAGQGVVEWSGANFSPTAFVPQDPYKDYEDEVIYFSEQLAPSFKTMFDNIWTNTKEYANYANVPPTLVRNYPTTPIDPRLNFPPKDSYQDRLVPLIDHEPAAGWIDVDIYRITMARPVDALIRAASRGVRIRMYLDPNEYANTLRPGNKVQMDRLVAAAKQYPGTIEIRMRKHLGLNHQKTAWFHAQRVVAFGTSNWSDASDDNQLEANIFTDRLPGDPLNDFVFDELYKVFNRKWHNSNPVGSIETEAWRTPTLPDPTLGDKCLDPKATNYGGPLPCEYPPPPPPPPPPDPNATTVVLYAAKGAITGTRWEIAADTTAAGGTALRNPNLNENKVAPALAAPASYVEMSFPAMKNTPYHMWVRLRAELDSAQNDSVHIQFNDAVTAPGSTTPMAQIGTATSAEFILQDGPSGGADVRWGWTDNGWDKPADFIYFPTSGTHTLRIQQREDGPYVDQIVLSPTTYFSAAPGPHTNDTTILPEGSLNDAAGSPTCSFSLSKSTANIAAAGGSDSIAVTAGAGCTWTASTTASWITVTAGQSGSGNGTVSFTAAQNTGAARSDTLTIAGKTVTVSQAAPLPSGATTVVVYASRGTITGTRWQLLADPTAAGGSAIDNPNLAQAKVAPALAAPASYVELPFDAMGGVAYHMWIRMRAEGDSTSNDSVHVQFSDAVTGSASTTPTMQFGTTSSAEFLLQDGSAGAVPSGWGWADNGWGVLGDPIYFAGSGTHTLRIQQREDGAIVDQIVLSPDTYFTTPPGALRNDTTILTETPGSGGGGGGGGGGGTPAGDIILHPSAAPVVVGNWIVNSDVTAAGGASLLNPDLNAPKVAAALASPSDYFEMTFDAAASTPYRVWIRGKATGNSWANDSAYVQFDNSLDANGAPIYTIGTANAASYSVEDCNNCGVAEWGWQDAGGYGAGISGPPVYFNAGQQRIRIQVREDGLAIDQIVLSPQRYLTQSPGLDKNDTTIVQP